MRWIGTSSSRRARWRAFFVGGNPAADEVAYCFATRARIAHFDYDYTGIGALHHKEDNRMDYLNTPGFLGTGAGLLADLTLLAYLLLLIPGMIAGLVFARRGQHRPHHKTAMIVITAINWVLIIFLMIAVYRTDVAANFPAQPGVPRYLMPTIHALFGLPAQLLATFIVVRMLREDSQVAAAKGRGEKDVSRYWWKSAKPIMRLTLALWLITASLGVITYLVRYNVLPTAGSAVIDPAATAEPAATPEATPGG